MLAPCSLLETIEPRKNRPEHVLAGALHRLGEPERGLGATLLELREHGINEPLHRGSVVVDALAPQDRY